ncbi:hypothetical protein NLG97_g4155 [Lecanicillium saksenae]|uniref:Uncharacterized protein n=1 Tax=Lecanicillium saksenae TaxID=468837 RepID=A0ACC1QYQ5_9HYPO|nr:hypothetical protein NLG97_g4155 [Lecanicillium saksenae]
MSTEPSNPSLSTSRSPMTLLVPFPRPSELCGSLAVASGIGGDKLAPTDPGEDWLPGQPAVPLSSSTDAMISYLRQDILTPRLDKMFPYLWLVATQSSSHISTLHEQIVRGRSIILTENPELHLVWAENRVFIKPIPLYLLSHAFWEVYLTPRTGVSAATAVKTPLLDPGSTTTVEEEREALLKATLGYMRTWHYLVRHESDFRLAQSLHLLPAFVTFRPASASKGMTLVPEPLTFATFLAFISCFSPEAPRLRKPISVTDEDVSLRYRYGQLRLTRLNLWAMPALGKWKFHKLSWQYADTFSRLYPPLLFAFALISIVLSAFQVGAQAAPQWQGFAAFAAWFAVVSLAVIGAISVFMLGLLLFMIMREFFFAIYIKLARQP